jgi:hypothetical protein
MASVSIMLLQCICSPTLAVSILVLALYAVQQYTGSLLPSVALLKAPSHVKTYMPMTSVTFVLLRLPTVEVSILVSTPWAVLQQIVYAEALLKDTNHLKTYMQLTLIAATALLAGHFVDANEPLKT